MALITWNDTYATHIASIDAQHKTLIDMINKIHDEICAPDNNSIIPNLLNEMAQYTATHFTHEEHLMTRHDYPDYPQHKKEHESFIEHTHALIEKFESEKQMLSVDIFVFLSEWLVNHIMKTDMKYVPSLRKQDIS